MAVHSLRPSIETSVLPLEVPGWARRVGYLALGYESLFSHRLLLGDGSRIGARGEVQMTASSTLQHGEGCIEDNGDYRGTLERSGGAWFSCLQFMLIVNLKSACRFSLRREIRMFEPIDMTLELSRVLITSIA